MAWSGRDLPISPSASKSELFLHQGFRARKLLCSAPVPAYRMNLIEFPGVQGQVKVKAISQEDTGRLVAVIQVVDAGGDGEGIPKVPSALTRMVFDISATDDQGIAALSVI